MKKPDFVCNTFIKNLEFPQKFSAMSQKTLSDKDFDTTVVLKYCVDKGFRKQEQIF
jgi:hypothetical protein